MKLSAPTTPVWWIAVILGGLGIVSHFVPIEQVSPHQYWLVAIGFVLLTLGTLLRKL